ncbi:hypothetical protein CBL_06184 [Carabus blaptoides fortunei]
MRIKSKQWSGRMAAGFYASVISGETGSKTSQVRASLLDCFHGRRDPVSVSTRTRHIKNNKPSKGVQVRGSTGARPVACSFTKSEHLESAARYSGTSREAPVLTCFHTSPLVMALYARNGPFQDLIHGPEPNKTASGFIR